MDQSIDIHLSWYEIIDMLFNAQLANMITGSPTLRSVKPSRCSINEALALSLENHWVTCYGHWDRTLHRQRWQIWHRSISETVRNHFGGV